MTPRAGRRIVVAIAAMVVAFGAMSLFRPGYSPDEEFTIFAVRGIRAHGLPLLPSGLLYDRGLLYSYLSWLAAALTGLELPAFRALSLLAAALSLVVSCLLLSRLVSPAAGAAAAALAATAVPFWAVATTGRFYAAFVLASVAILWALAHLSAPVGTRGHPPAPVGTRPHPSAPARTWVGFCALVFASRLLHELAFTLLAIPVAALLLRRPRDAHVRQLAAALGTMAAALAAAQVSLMALHFLVPPAAGGGTMIRRFFLWQVLNLFETPHGAPLGVVLVATVVAWLIAPARALQTTLFGIAAAMLMSVGAVAVAMTASPVSATLFGEVVRGGLAYPLDLFWSLAASYPVMIGLALTLLVARLLGAGGAWPPAERATHLAWIAWCLWFGVIESGITTNYELLPAVCALAAIGVDLVAIGRHTAAIWPGRRAQLIRAGLTGLALMVAADQWGGGGSPAARLAEARPTMRVPGLDELSSQLRPDDRVGCTDELACLLLLGRIDAWVALDDYVRERFVVTSGSRRTGVYTGAPAVFDLAELMALVQDDARRLVLLDVFKQYPVGHSRGWLPRAIAAARLEAVPLLETEQARVVELRR